MNRYCCDIMRRNLFDVFNLEAPMSIFNAEDSTRSSLDRVRSSTASHVNEEIDLQTDINIQRYKGKNKTEILERIQMLDKDCLLYTSPSPRDGLLSRMPS